MKKLITFCAVICLTCTCLLGTAFASSAGSFPPVPSLEGYDAFIVYNDMFEEYRLYRFPEIAATGLTLTADGVELSNFDFYASYHGGDWYLSSHFDESRLVPIDSPVFYSTLDIYDEAGNLVFKGTSGNSDIDAPILPTVVSDGFLYGVLGEVLAVVVVAVPVLVVCLGIRKGIAFLLGRLRSA